MSRSRKKRPFSGITTAPSEKRDKRICNRSMRKENKIRMRLGEEADFIDKREAMNAYSMAKDGRMRFDPERHPRLMRK